MPSWPGQWRFDASDLMSPGVGAIAAVGTPGAFLQGMTDYVDQSPTASTRFSRKSMPPGSRPRPTRSIVDCHLVADTHEP